MFIISCSPKLRHVTTGTHRSGTGAGGCRRGRTLDLLYLPSWIVGVVTVHHHGFWLPGGHVGLWVSLETTNDCKHILQGLFFKLGPLAHIVPRPARCFASELYATRNENQPRCVSQYIYFRGGHFLWRKIDLGIFWDGKFCSHLEGILVTPNTVCKLQHHHVPFADRLHFSSKMSPLSFL